MTINDVQDQPRDAAGKFGEKTGSKPGISLAAPTKPLQDSLDLLSRENWDTFPLALQESAIAAARDPELDEAGVALAAETADACESWNFHGTSMRIRSALAHRAHLANPDAPLTDPYSMAFDPETSTDMLRRISKDHPVADYAFVQNDNTPDDVLNDVLTREAAIDSITYLSAGVAKHPNASVETLTRILDGDAAAMDWVVRLNLAENKNTPIEAQVRLIHDANRAVAAAAMKATEPPAL